MRPDHDAYGRPSRAADNDGSATFGLPGPPPMSYIITDEASIGSSSSSAPQNHHQRAAKRPAVLPPPSLAPADSAEPRRLSPHRPHLDLASAGPENKGVSTAPVSAPALRMPRADVRPPQHHGGSDDAETPAAGFPPSSFATPSYHGNNSHPLTPVLLSGPASVALSGMSSRRNSFSLSEDLSSRPPSIYNDDDHHGDGRPFHHQYGDSPHRPTDAENTGVPMDSSTGSAPQLIMPSIKMPSRRPFTDRGKNIGRLKVLVAGDSGVGKTSLIKAIVQSCEHIVHVDSLGTDLAPSSLTGSGTLLQFAGSGGAKTGAAGRKRKLSKEEANRIAEVYASTKPYPEWWAEVDDFRVLQRRKSLGDSVLDRNLCFVDTPGYGCGSSSMDTITPVTDYVKGHLRRIQSGELSDGDMLNLLGGDGGVQVDAVFYMVSNRLRPVDIQYLKHLAPLSNIILLLAQSDLMSLEQVEASKAQIRSQLKEAAIHPFSFSSSDPEKQGIYAVSSATGSDNDTMDASLLMSPDYVQPLASSELGELVENVFSPNGASWLRHAAARKYVQWRKGEAREPAWGQLHGGPLNHRGPGGVMGNTHSSQVLTPPMGATSSYALARITDHTQREERLAQVRLANWASELQKSLAREKLQYAALAQGERAVWLTEKIGECLNDGSLVAVSAAEQHSPSLRRAAAEARLLKKQRYRFMAPPGSGAEQQTQDSCHREDPLGLLEVAAKMRQNGLTVIEVVGSLSVIGGLVILVGRHYLHLVDSGWDWGKLWGLDL